MTRDSKGDCTRDKLWRNLINSEVISDNFFSPVYPQPEPYNNQSGLPLLDVFNVVKQEFFNGLQRSER